jgi:signal transduction histidine kinase
MKKRSITVKIILSGVLVMFLSSFVPNVLWRLFGEGVRPDEVNPTVILFGGIITVSFTLLFYSFLLDRLLIKRVKSLNEATKSIIEGNFESVLEDHHHDEISELTNNFNLMVSDLQNNEYLNKDFVRNFSHELKTPLSAIKGYAELLHPNALTEEERIQYTNIIIEESARLSNLSKNMLLISQIDNQVIVPTSDTFNITELLRNVIQLQQLDWDQKELSFDLDFNEITITSNKELIYQVFQNLLSNAIKFSNRNDTIEMSMKQSNKTKFTIRNKGKLSEEELSKIFDLFYIKDKSRSTKSNGIGLTLTKKIVEKLNGTISATSDKETIIFTVEL